MMGSWRPMWITEGRCWPHWHLGKHITRCPQYRRSMEKSGYVHAWRSKDITEHLLKLNRLFSEALALLRATNSLPRKARYVSRHFCRSCLKTNKLSKSEETRKVEYAYNCRKCTGTVYPKLSKLVHTWWNYSLPKLARVFETQCSLCNYCFDFCYVVWMSVVLECTGSNTALFEASL